MPSSTGGVLGDDKNDNLGVTPQAYLQAAHCGCYDDDDEEEHCAICLDELGYHPLHAEMLAEQEWERERKLKHQRREEKKLNHYSPNEQKKKKFALFMLPFGALGKDTL